MRALWARVRGKTSSRSSSLEELIEGVYLLKFDSIGSLPEDSQLFVFKNDCASLSGLVPSPTMYRIAPARAKGDPEVPDISSVVDFCSKAFRNREQGIVSVVSCSEEIASLLKGCLLFVDGQAKTPVEGYSKARRKRLVYRDSWMAKLQFKALFEDFAFVLAQFPGKEVSEIDFVVPRLAIRAISIRGLADHVACRLVLFLVQGTSFLYSSVQEGKQCVDLSAKKSFVPCKKAEFSDTVTLKVYFLPEDLSIDNPRELLFECTLNSGLLALKMSGDLRTQSWGRVQVDSTAIDFSKCDCREISRDGIQVLLTLAHAGALVDIPASDAVAAAAEGESKLVEGEEEEEEEEVPEDPDLAEDEFLARSLQDQFNREYAEMAAQQRIRRVGRDSSEDKEDSEAQMLLREFLVRQMQLYNIGYPGTAALQGCVLSEIETLPLIRCTAESKWTRESCMVCRDAFEGDQELRVLPCLHAYHRECIDHWLRTSRQCPICQHPVTRRELEQD